MNNDRRALAVVCMSIATLNVAVLTAAHLAFPDLSLRAHVRAPAAPQLQPAEPDQPEREAEFVAPTIATRALLAAINVDLEGMTEGPWAATAVEQQLYGSPFKASCDVGLPGPALPVVAVSRTFSGPVSEGVQLGPTSLTRMWAYGPGQGAAGFEQFRTRLSRCNAVRPVHLGPTEAPADVLAVTHSAVPGGMTWLLFRHGDVLAAMAFTGTWQGEQRQVLIDKVDQKLRASLAEVCPQVDSTLADVARNPRTRAAVYRPHHRPVEVTLDPALIVQPGPLPTPTPVTLERPIEYDLEVAAQLADPALIPEPAVIATERPVEQPHPLPAQTSQAVDQQIPDPVGPGCGWKFLNQPAPAFDRGLAAEQLSRDTLVAQDTLITGQERYRAALASYAASAASFQRQLAEYELYRDYLAARQVAQEAYDRSRTPEPSPTPSPSPTATASPSATPAPSAGRRR